MPPDHVGENAGTGASEQLFRRLLGTAPDAMAIVDGAGTIGLVNARAEALLGQSAVQLAGRPIDAFVPGWAGLEAVECPVEICLTPLSTDGGPLIVAALRDVSERRQEQGELTRLYEQQRHIALTLQHSLMGQPPEIPGVLTARRYRPATSGAGVGGDWFDLVGLGAGRVGVFIGDVMGRGLEAAAVMGRLRSAGNALARTGMSPRRLMQGLDNVVADLPDQFVTGCYLVADWEVGEVAVCSAGHLPVLVIGPDGGPEPLPVPVGVPLGVGDVPHQQVRIPVPAGSTLVFYTDGLVETKDSDIDVQIKTLAMELQSALAAGLDLEQTADHVLSALLTPEAAAYDDVTLLLVRLPPAPIDLLKLVLVAEPSSVPKARRFVGDALSTWGLSDDVAEVARLLTSEVVTNAVRHGRGPLRLRIRRGIGEVTVEVTDRSTHALPRPCATACDEESGRGLLLVDTLSERWGTSPVDNGKTVWFTVLV